VKIQKRDKTGRNQGEKNHHNTANFWQVENLNGQTDLRPNSDLNWKKNSLERNEWQQDDNLRVRTRI